MRNKIYSLCMVVALFVSGMLIAGCNKNDNNNPQEPAKVQTYHMLVCASKGTDNPSNGPKRVLGLDGSTLNATWAIGEEVTVYNETKSTAISGVLTAQSNGASTTLEGELTGIIEPSDVLTLKFLSPNYTEQKGTLEYISANCDYAEASIIVASISGENISSTTDAIFENKQAIVKFTLIDKADGITLLKPSTLTINDGTSDIATLTDISAATYATNGDGVLYVAVPGFSDKMLTLTATIGTKTYSYEKGHVTFENGHYYIITMKMEKDLPQGALSGEFSINSTHKIRFSKGNLQYNASQGTHKCIDGSTKQGTWRFAENQWDYIGNNNRNASSTYSGWTDLFSWASSGNYINPWTITVTYTLYRINGSYDNDITGTNYDWGVYNAISNGGNTPNKWRTLTKEEWQYIISQRSSASSKRALGTVAGKKGLILLPNNWTLPAGCSFRTQQSENIAGYETNIYTAEQWTQMQKAGAVFFPAAGYREPPYESFDIFMTDVGTKGVYWSTTASNSSSSTAYLYASLLGFGVNSYSIGSTQYDKFLLSVYNGTTSSTGLPADVRRYDGISVRLVQDVE